MVKGFPTLQRKLNKAANFNRRKNSILSRWYNVTWQIDGSGRVYNTPTLGSELLTNTEFTSSTTGWTAESSATLTRRDYSSSPVIAPTGGTDNFGMEISNAGSGLSRGVQSFSASVGTWVQASARVYAPGTNTSVNGVGFYTTNTNGVAKTVTAEDIWQTVVVTARVTAVSPVVKLTRGSTAEDIGHFDAISAKTISLPTTLATVNGSANNLTVAAKIHTIITGTQVGVASLIDSSSNPQNFIIAYHDGTNVILEKCVAGVYTQLISTAVTFVSNSQIEIRRPSGNTFQLWYNGAQIDTDQTVSDSEIINNNLYGMFSTYSGNLISEFTLGGVVIPFTF